MRKLIESTFVTLDGVIADPHLWSGPYWDAEHSGYSADLLFGADALLLGRETYLGFAEVWPQRAGADEYTDRINAMPKYVASTTLDPQHSDWNATVLRGDTVSAIRALKEQEGGNILKFGTGSLSRLLLEHKLVDEFHLWVFPVFAGAGTRLFDGAAEQTHLEPLGATTFRSGIVVHRLAPR